MCMPSRDGIVAERVHQQREKDRKKDRKTEQQPHITMFLHSPSLHFLLHNSYMAAKCEWNARIWFNAAAVINEFTCFAAMNKWIWIFIKCALHAYLSLYSAKPNGTERNETELESNQTKPNQAQPRTSISWTHGCLLCLDLLRSNEVVHL